MVQPLWGAVWRFFNKLKPDILYDPVIPLLDIFTKKTIVRKDTYMPIFIAAQFFPVARTRRQPISPSTGVWIMKTWYIYTSEYYSAIKTKIMSSKDNCFIQFCFLSNLNMNQS